MLDLGPTKRVIGIDPGRKGAIALFDGETLVVHDMPDTIPGVQDTLRRLVPATVCVLEKPFYPHGVGTKTVSVIAENYGVLKATLVYLGVPIREIQPSKWKPAMGLSKDKGASRRMASEAFPDFSDLFARVKDDGRAEAALLALYGRENR